MNIQKRIDSLQPYVLQIRFLNGISIVDAVFKNGWKVPESNLIEAVKGEDKDNNYYMIYTERENLGIDDVLEFIEKVIEINIEREKKYELLKVKTEELKDVFRRNPLNKLESMKFILGDETSIPESMTEDFDEITMDDIDEELTTRDKLGGDFEEEPTPTKKKQGLQNKPVIEQVGNQKIELPPRGEKIEVETYDGPEIVCKCSPEDVCPVCIDDKM